MPSRPSCARARAAVALLAVCGAILPALSCSPTSRPLLPRSQTWAELRTIRRAVTVTLPAEMARAPYPRERLVDGEALSVADGGLAWLRRDGGAGLLVRGLAELTLRSDAVDVASGRVFIDTPAGLTTDVVTPGGALHLAHVRASIDVGAAGTEVYVLSGEVRVEASLAGGQGGSVRAAAGERLTVTGAGKEARATVAPVLSWEDWTGGLATTDRVAEPSPYGVGTVGARLPGDQGSPRFPGAAAAAGRHPAPGSRPRGHERGQATLVRGARDARQERRPEVAAEGIGLYALRIDPADASAVTLRLQRPAALLPARPTRVRVDALVPTGEGKAPRLVTTEVELPLSGKPVELGWAGGAWTAAGT